MAPLEHLATALSQDSTDARGVSEILGLVFAFALVISVVATAQLAMSPVLTAGDEADHQHRAVADLAELDAALFSAASTGENGRVAVETDVTYPERYLVVTPPTSTGTLDTVDGDRINVSVANAKTVGPSSVYWNGAPKDLGRTEALFYTQNYNERNTETLYVESAVSYLVANDGTEVVHRQSLVRGTDIRLVLVQGELDGQTVAGQTVGYTPVTASEQTLTVKSTDDEPLTITVPTTLSNDSWAELLASEDDVVKSFTYAPYGPDSEYATLTVVLKPGLYDLQIARVSIGASATDPENGVFAVPPGPDSPSIDDSVAYLVLESANGTWIPTGGRETIVVRALDEYGDPVVGATLEADGGTYGTLSAPDGMVTDENGRVTLRYAVADGSLPDSYEDDSVEIWIGNGASKKTVVVKFEIRQYDDGVDIGPI